MRRPDLEGLPRSARPRGYTLRQFQPGDEPAWAETCAAAFPEQPDPRGITEREFLSKPLWDAQRIFFACAADVPVACCGAWANPEAWGQRTGQIHWVATHPAHLRRGLARAVVLAALHWMQAHGYEDAILVTQVYRIPAIRLYLDLGFVPWLDFFPEMPQRWASVKAALR